MPSQVVPRNSPTTIQLRRRRFELVVAEQTMLIGRRIAEARAAADLTQTELAAKIPGKSDGTQVSKWERGMHRPGDDTLEHIASALDRDVAWFLLPDRDQLLTPEPVVPDDQLARIEQKLDRLLALFSPQDATNEGLAQAARALLALAEAGGPATSAVASGSRGRGRRARVVADAFMRSRGDTACAWWRCWRSMPLRSRGRVAKST